MSSTKKGPQASASWCRAGFADDLQRRDPDARSGVCGKAVAFPVNCHRSPPAYEGGAEFLLATHVHATHKPSAMPIDSRQYHQKMRAALQVPRDSINIPQPAHAYAVRSCVRERAHCLKCWRGAFLLVRRLHWGACSALAVLCYRIGKLRPNVLPVAFLDSSPGA